MNYSHLEDATRLASVTVNPPAGGKTAAVVRWTEEGGKSRKKSFKKGSEYEAVSSAARFLLGQGFILRGPQEGRLKWMTAIAEPYPHGFPLAIDPTSGDVWIGGTGALIRVTPETCDGRDFRVGTGVMVRSVGCSAHGHVFAVLDQEEGNGPLGDAPWRAPGRGPFAFGIVSVTASGAVQALASVPHEGLSAIAHSLSVADSGKFIGPHVDGAALYGPDGTVQRTFAAARTEHCSPEVALSRNGRWAAITTDEGAIRRVDLVEDADIVLDGQFSQVHSIHAQDDGTLLVGGFIYPSWGVYRMAIGAEPVRLFESMGGALTPSGDAVIESSSNSVARRELIPDAEDWPKVTERVQLPQLCGVKEGKVHWVDATHVLVATRSHTLACVDVSALPPEEG